jgi:hypothetical protein
MHYVTGRQGLFDPINDGALVMEIVEREFISIDYDKDWVYDPTNVDPEDEPDNGDRWYAWLLNDQTKFSYGPTAKIAILRCFVASKLGDEVDVPEALL